MGRPTYHLEAVFIIERVEGCSISHLEMRGGAVVIKKGIGRKTQFQYTFQSRIPLLKARVFRDQIPGHFAEGWGGSRQRVFVQSIRVNNLK